MPDRQVILRRVAATALVLAVLGALCLASLYSYLLFHVIVEMSSIAVGVAVFLVVWNSRRFVQNNYLVLVGVASLFVAGIDLVHTLAFAGMGIFDQFDPRNPAGLAPQLWIAARYVQAVSLLAAPLFLNRRLNPYLALGVYGVAFYVLMLAIFDWRAFPACYVAGRGVPLTFFKVQSEWLICIVLSFALSLLLRQRKRFDRGVLTALALSIAVMIPSELLFTGYKVITDEFNMAGHLLKLVSALLLYRALVQTSLTRPHDLLFRELVAGREALRGALHEAQRSQGEIEALLEASRAVLKSRDFENAARAIFDSCRRVTGATAGYVALLSADGQRNEVLFLEAGGQPCTVDPSLAMPIRGLRAEAYRLREAVFDNAFASGPHAALLPGGHVRLENVLFAPLTLQDKAVGLIGLGNKPGGFTERDARLATAFGELAAVALVNSRTLASLVHSEERFRTVAQTATDAIVTVDSTGRVTLWNRAAEAIFGRTTDEMLGRRLSEIVPERYRKRHALAMERLAAGGETTLIGKTIELSGLRRDGTEFPLELSLARWHTDEGTFFTGIVRDISERKGTEQERERLLNELDAEKVKLSAIIQCAPEGIVMIDPRGRPVIVNPVALALYRGIVPYDGDSCAPGAPRICHVDGEAYDYQALPLLRAARDGEAFSNQEIALVWPDGERRDLLQNVAPLRDSQGELIGAVAVFQDMSQQHRLRAELLRRAEQLQTLVQEAHHRIRNNLQSVISLLELERDEVDPASVGSLERCVSRIRAIAMVHRLLTAEASSSVPILGLLKGLAELAEATYGQPGVKRVEIGVSGTNLPVPSRAATSLAIVINELISNAMLHAFPGSAEGRVSVSVAQADGEVEIQVADNGVGCPPEVKPGTGLLLARTIIEHDLHGTFRMESRLTGGCRCVFSFPA